MSGTGTSIPRQVSIKAHSSLRCQTCYHSEAREAVTGPESGAEPRGPDLNIPSAEEGCLGGGQGV